jgi:hypothetical protein
VPGNGTTVQSPGQQGLPDHRPALSSSSVPPPPPVLLQRQGIQRDTGHSKGKGSSPSGRTPRNVSPNASRDGQHVSKARVPPGKQPFGKRQRQAQ